MVSKPVAACNATRDHRVHNRTPRFTGLAVASQSGVGDNIRNSVTVQGTTDVQTKRRSRQVPERSEAEDAAPRAHSGVRQNAPSTTGRPRPSNVKTIEGR